MGISPDGLGVRMASESVRPDAMPKGECMTVENVICSSREKKHIIKNNLDDFVKRAKMSHCERSEAI
jgi:hypothetical protein